MPLPAEILLNHFDRLAKTEPKFTCVSDEGVEPRTYVATYFGFPDMAAVTGFTIGLSHFHPPGGSHKELMISMHDANDVWALACGFAAFQLRESNPFTCGDTINFNDQIAPSSRMSAFVVVHPHHISTDDRCIDLGVRKVELMQLIPLYEHERSWFLAGGDLELFLNAYSTSELMNPNRAEFAL